MNIFRKLLGVFSGEELPIVPEKYVKYVVIVEMEHHGVLMDEKKIKEAICSCSKQNELKGHIYSGICFAETGPNTNSLAPVVRRFFLTDQSDFELFTQAMKAIDGVIGVKKDDGPWLKTATEKQMEKEERRNVAQENKKKAEESFKKRECKLADLKKLNDETMRSDEETYGPLAIVARLRRKEFPEFLSSIGCCKVEARVVFSDILVGGFFDYKREVAELPGDEVISFFEKTINGVLRMPFHTQSSFDDIPFSVEYRQNNGRKFAHLMVGSGNPTFIMASYNLFVRG